MVQPFIPNSVDAAITEQAEPDSVDFEYLTAASALTGIVSGCVLSEDPVTPDLTVDVTVGVVRLLGKPIAVSAQLGNVITAAHGTLTRIDLVSVNNAGTVVVTAGTAAAEPVAPDLPATSVQLGQVYVPATDTAITDAQIVTKRTMVPAATVFDVTWYGATGDGATDDTTAIQAAIVAADAAGGGEVYFPVPASAYNFTDTLDLYDNVTLRGANRGGTFLDYSGANVAITNVTPGTRIYNVFLENLYIRDDTSSCTTVIDWDDISAGGMTAVEIWGFTTATALELSGTSGGGGVYNNFYDVYVPAALVALKIVGTSTNTNRFFGCRFSGVASAGGIGVQITNGNNNTFYGTSVETGETGVLLDGATVGAENLFVGTRFEGNTDGVNITGAACRGNEFIGSLVETVTNPYQNTSGWSNNFEDNHGGALSSSSAYVKKLNDTWGLIIDAGSPEAVRAADPGMLYINSTDGRPWYKATGTGNTGWAPIGGPAEEYAAARTLDLTDSIVNMESTAATRAVTLPDNATFDGKAYMVHRDGTNNVTVTRAGSDTFDDGNTIQTLATDGASIGFYSIGDGEWKIAGTSGTVTGS